MKKQSVIIATIALIIITISVAFAYGAVSAGNSASDKQSAYERMNDYDWSKTCPAASCRNQNEE